MPKRFNRLVFVVAILALLLSCSKVPYKSALREWSKGDNIYCPENFVAKLLWHATYLSPEFRSVAKAQVDEWKKLGPGGGWGGEYAGYLADTEGGAFLVAVYTPRGYPAINVKADNFWDLTLDLPTGESLSPAAIETVDVTMREMRLFPYIDRWSKLYQVRFPVSHLERPFTLSLRSAGVTSFLKWK